MWKTIAALANFVRQGLQAQHYAVDVAEDGEGARVMRSEIDYDLMILDLNVPRVMMEASPDTFAWSSGIRSSTLTSEFNLLLPIISLAAPHDQQVSCHALLLQVKISGTESQSGNPVATSSDAGDESFSVSRVEVRLFLWAGKNSFVWIQQELAGPRRRRQVK